MKASCQVHGECAALGHPCHCDAPKPRLSVSFADVEALARRKSDAQDEAIGQPKATDELWAMVGGSWIRNVTSDLESLGIEVTRDVVAPAVPTVDREALARQAFIESHHESMWHDAAKRWDEMDDGHPARIWSGRVIKRSEVAVRTALGVEATTVTEVLADLDEMNAAGRIEYSDYSHLRDAVAALWIEEPK